MMERPGHGAGGPSEVAREKAIAALLDPALDPIVEMVLCRRDGADEAHAPDGWVRFRRRATGAHEILAGEGRNPLADQAVDRFAGLDAELAARFPTRTANSYPFAYDQVAQLFDAPNAPDLCVLHTAAHNWEEQGGHRGEHGSLGVVQARAPFIAAGKGVRARGVVDDVARLVDVAPTVCGLLGATPTDDHGGYLAHQDGAARADVIDDGARPRTVVGFLLDGVNPNVLYAMAGDGEAPNVARLMAMGTSYRYGAMAGLPTVTLANHTSIITGVLPGHHHVLHNAWFDRATGEQVITNSPATWPWAMRWLAPGVETIHAAVHRTWPDAFTVSIDEPCDSQADYSTFDFFRRGEVPPIPTDPNDLPHTTQRWVRPSKNYAWSSVVDHMAVEQACGIWAGSYRGETYPRPRFMWVNFTLTDSAMHDGGPHSDIAHASVRDTDARIGAILAAIEQAGAFDDSAFVLVADHGMEETDPEVTGDWDVALRDAGLAFRDEGYGFIYLTGDDA